MLKSIGFQIQIPYVFIFKNDEILAVPSFVLSTLFACALLTFIPQLAPLWSMGATSKIGGL